MEKTPLHRTANFGRKKATTPHNASHEGCAGEDGRTGLSCYWGHNTQASFSLSKPPLAEKRCVYCLKRCV